MKLAHLSDPHLPIPETPSFRQLANKRFLGWRSWQKRKHIHRPEVLAALCADMAAAAPDHVAVTGDLTNISLTSEFAAAARWLESLGEPGSVTVIPGNHDAYVDRDRAEGWRLWAANMSSDHASGTHPEFPFLRVRDGVALIGLSSAVATAPGLASGSLGATQIERLETLLDETGREGLCRVILVHHPVIEGTVSPRKSLNDARAFRKAVGRAGAELILHGHGHVFSAGEVAGKTGGVPVLGIPSASAVAHGARPAAHYQLLDIEREEGAWRINRSVRGYLAEKGRFGDTAGKESLHASATRGEV